jgi:hypothetical protein
MNTLYIAFDKALVIAHQQHQRWEAHFHLEESQPQCLAIDPLHPQNVYCGTFDQGLWQSLDAGATWKHAGAGIASEKVMAVAVSLLEQAHGSARAFVSLNGHLVVHPIEYYTCCQVPISVVLPRFLCYYEERCNPFGEKRSRFSSFVSSF